MKIINLISNLFILICLLNILNSQTSFDNFNSLNTINTFNKSKPSILNHHQLGLNHSFSIVNSNINGHNQVFGIYSNLATYPINNNLELKMGFQIINNSNPYFDTNQSNLHLDYQFGLQYQLHKNSVINIQFSKFTNPLLFSKFDY